MDMDRHSHTQTPWCKGLMAGLWQSRAEVESTRGPSCFRSTYRTAVSRSASDTWACSLKAALIGLELYQGFTTSHLDPKAPIKAPLSTDGCQLFFFFFCRRRWVQELLSSHVDDVIPFHICSNSVIMHISLSY